MAGVSTVLGPQAGEEESVDIAWGRGHGLFFPTVVLH